VLSGEAKIPILKSGLTRPGLEPTIYRTQGELANYYNTNAVVSFGGHDHCLIEHSAGRHDARFFQQLGANQCSYSFRLFSTKQQVQIL